MTMGRRTQRQESLFVLTEDLASSAGHPFYKKLNALLAEADFDRWIEGRCQQYYEQQEKRGQHPARRLFQHAPGGCRLRLRAIFRQDRFGLAFSPLSRKALTV